MIDQLKTRVVVPLLPVASTPPPIGRLNPVFEISGRKVVMATPLLAAVSFSELGEARASLAAHHDAIVAALEMLFQGF